MSGLERDGSRLIVTFGSRTVLATDGTLLQFLSSEQEFTTDFVYPNPTLTEIYTWYYRTVVGGGGDIGYNGNCRSVVGARIQEWSDDIVLGPSPPGADLWLGTVNLIRTVDPTHTWLGQSLSPTVEENEDIQLWGSMPVEIGPCISRGLTVDVVPSETPGEPGELVLRLAQTIGPTAGNFRTYGFVPARAGMFTGDVYEGIQNSAAGGGTAIPVYWRDGAPWSFAYSGTGSDAGGVESVCNSFNRGGGNDATYPGAGVNYSSTYALTLRGSFGRRS